MASGHSAELRLKADQRNNQGLHVWFQTERQLASYLAELLLFQRGSLP